MKNENVNEKVKAAFGYSDEQLLAEFEAAEDEWMRSPELQEELKAPDEEFERILEMAHERKRQQEAEKGFLAWVKNWFIRLFHQKKKKE